MVFDKMGAIFLIPIKNRITKTFDIVMFLLFKYSGGHEYRTLEYWMFWSSDFQWFVIPIFIAMVLTIPKPNHWKSEQNGMWNPMILDDKMGTILFRTEHHLKIK